MPEVDDDQLAALRRLRAVFGSMEVVEVISHDPAVAPDESIEGEDGGPAADAPEEEAQAHALLTRAVSGPNWRGLEVVERLANRERRPIRCNGGRP